MLDRLRNNLGLKLLALVLAVGAWAYFRFAASPAIAAHFDQQLSVPIVAVGLSADEIARYPDKQAVVTIVSPRGATSPVRPDDLRAVLDLAGREAGVHAVPITIIAPRLEVKQVSPSSETLTIERVQNHTVPVSVRYVGDPRAVVSDGVSFEPKSVAVRGAADDLGRVAAARVDVQLPSQAGRVDAMMRAVPTDARGDEVNGVSVAPNLVRVRATFRPAQKGP